MLRGISGAEKKIYTSRAEIDRCARAAVCVIYIRLLLFVAMPIQESFREFIDFIYFNVLRVYIYIYERHCRRERYLKSKERKICRQFLRAYINTSQRPAKINISMCIYTSQLVSIYSNLLCIANKTVVVFIYESFIEVNARACFRRLVDTYRISLKS